MIFWKDRICMKFFNASISSIPSNKCFWIYTCVAFFVQTKIILLSIAICRTYNLFGSVIHYNLRFNCVSLLLTWIKPFLDVVSMFYFFSIFYFFLGRSIGLYPTSTRISWYWLVNNLAFPGRENFLLLIKTFSTQWHILQAALWLIPNSSPNLKYVG